MAAEMPDTQGPASEYCMPSCKSVLVLNALLQLSRIIVCLLCDKASFSKWTPVHQWRLTSPVLILLLSQILTKRGGLLFKYAECRQMKREKSVQLLHGKYFLN